MIAGLSPGFRRMLAILLLLAVPLVVYVTLIEPVAVMHRHLDSEWHQKRQLLSRYRESGQALAAIEAARQRLDDQATETPPHVDAPSDTLVVTKLLDLLNGIAVKNGAVVVGTRVLPAVEEGEFRQVALRVTMTAKLGPLHRVIYTLESDRPILFVDDLTIQSSAVGSATAQAEDPELSVSFNLFAYRRAV